MTDKVTPLGTCTVRNSLTGEDEVFVYRSNGTVEVRTPEEGLRMALYSAEDAYSLYCFFDDCQAAEVMVELEKTTLEEEMERQKQDFLRHMLKIQLEEEVRRAFQEYREPYL